MEIADTGSAVPAAISGRKKKRACQRCRQRKQKCDLAEPCHNCVTAGVECAPVPQEVFESYPVGYVSALEQHAAMLERSLNESFPGSAPDHLNRNESRGSISELHHSSLSLGQINLSPMSSNNQLSMAMENPYQDFNMNEIPRNGRSFDFAARSSPIPATSPVLVTASHISPPAMSQHTVASEKVTDEAEDVPTITAASFFRTYFQFIHPQYPFLSVRQCADWYISWKLAKQNNEEFTGWPAFFVKLIFSIGSLIQSKSDETPRYQHHGLKSQVQNEDDILQDLKSPVLIRFQAMLMLAMHALHSDSTARIAYITGATMRFATLHRFHSLIEDGSDDSMMKIRVWSCAYVLDRAVSATLDVPVSLAEAYISTTLFSEDFESEAPQVWLQDCVASTIPDLPQSLSTFSHICKIRYIQSYILHTLHTSPSTTSPDPDWQASIHAQISSWASSISQHSFPSSQGYQSPLWLSLIGQLSRLIIYRPTRSTASTTIGDVALRASCDACTTFRELQKKRQIAQPWLAVLTQFQAGVTIYYVAYRRAAPLPKEADFAVRDCTSVLAILADRWRTAEHYRDCFELLVRVFSQAERGDLSEVGPEIRELLTVLVERVLESGVHGHVADMLREICEDGRDGVGDNVMSMLG